MTNAQRDEGLGDAALIRRTLEYVSPVADEATGYFYALLFLHHPHTRDMFPVAMDTQRDRLFKALLAAGLLLEEPDRLTAFLRDLGRGHRKYGTRSPDYPAVGQCLLAALARYAGEVWSPRTEAAWVRAYAAISQTMIDAAEEDALRNPPWWLAEIVSHEARTTDVAVLIVRPEQPYAFTPGQYTAIETPWWPRVWRHYSFATAPRADGLLSFHVRAVPAGWVSTSLVRRARPGDVVRLGPPLGSMTVDHTAASDLLCLGGGTGIAPIRAMVEDVARHGSHREMQVFYGARREDDLYDLENLRRFERAYSWLTVHPVVGALPEAVSRRGPWTEYDAYLAGPPPMVRSGVRILTEGGVPAGAIRHDDLEHLVRD
ncbi:Flavohemoprotein [Streptomyces sp. RB5]|uniref:nitric oxide dioxygenase n=1 Tax=Streptomyces smaragdinus TaxID=2585196 RepID=A0A7K0CND5_9ACTN|nr:globin domain-containing protein [Streptomyces smaragdinus]MQY14274.1 Flavohemoprotein [Streptomyces smaragdinus]